MDSGYRAVRYESRIVGEGLCEDDRRSRSVWEVVLLGGTGSVMKNSCQSVSCLIRLPNTSGVIDRCRKRLGEGERKAACSGLNEVQRDRSRLSRYAVGGVECIRYVPICAQG
jgi:hypothetical protein